MKTTKGSTDEWRKKTQFLGAWFLNAMKYYSATKKNEILMVWLELQMVMFSEISRAHKNNGLVISLLS